MNRSDLHLVESAPLRYLLSLPPAPARAVGGWPVLCFLHGYDEAAPLEIHRALTRHGPLRPGSSRQAMEEFVVVAPQLPAPGGDAWRRYAEAVQQIVRQVQALYGGHPQRTYLTGFSFGGNGAFDLALRQRDFWAALWAVDPTRVPHADPRLPIWLSFGAVSRPREAPFCERLQLVPAADAPSGDRLYRDQGLDHVGAATEAYQDEEIYCWLLSQRLPSIPA